jgi:GYF domain 2
MYKIIGADKNEYGPVSGEQLREWIQQGRVGAQTLAQAEGQTDWRPVIAFPEFAEALAAKPPSSPPPFAAGGTTGVAPEILDRDYDLDLGGCISRGWNLLQKNMGLLVGATLIYLGIAIAMSLLGAIPLIGAIFSLLSLFVTAPLMGGLFYVTLQAIRQQPASAGDVFEGFRRAFIQLVLGYIVPAILTSLCVIPAVVVGLVTLLPAVTQNQEPSLGAILATVGVGLVCLLPLIFLTVNWMFTLPLIVDKRLDFWPAMQTSWKMVRKHWWQLFGLIILVGVLNLAGVLLCCVGLLFSMPLGFAAMMYAYETIFSPLQTQNP